MTLPDPPAGWVAVVLHTVHGVTRLESRKLGQMTVWVDGQAQAARGPHRSHRRAVGAGSRSGLGGQQTHTWALEG